MVTTITATKIAKPSIQAKKVIINFRNNKASRRVRARFGRGPRLRNLAGGDLLTCLGVFGKEHFEDDGEDGADDQNFQHEVVQSFYEKFAEGFRLQRLAIVASKMLRSLREVGACQTDLGFDLELVKEGLQACHDTAKVSELVRVGWTS